MARPHRRLPFRIFSLSIVIAAVLSCGGNNHSLQQQLQSICNCQPEPGFDTEFRHAEKHIPLPAGPTTPVTVEQILAWKQHEIVADGPRHGRENTLVQVDNAYLQWASVQTSDCDLHLEISATPEKSAPRVMVETPIDTEYCPARTNLQTQLQQRGIDLNGVEGGELPIPLPVVIQGLPFEDFEHNRGSALLATSWELHPAIVTLK